MRKLSCLPPLLCLLASGCQMTPEDTLDLRSPGGTVVRVLKQFEAEPDSHGVMKTLTLQLPPYRQGVYYVGEWWPGGGNRVYPSVFESARGLPEGGLFLILELSPRDYLALLPLAGGDAYAWFAAEANRLLLKLGTHGRAPIAGDVPLVAWSRAASPYAAAANVWKAASEQEQIRGAMLLREQKQYPEVFRYLGWCSWEHFKNNIDERKMVQAVREIERSGVPVRFFLVDDGHFDRRSLRPDPSKFPHGYRPLTNLRNDAGIKWFGLWWGFLGNNHGIKAPGELGPLRASMITTPVGVLAPKPGDAEAAWAFYDYLMRLSREGGFDFLKVDFMVDALPLYAGPLAKRNPTLGGLPPDNSQAVDNPYAASATLMRVFQEAAGQQMHGLINCNWHSAFCLFHSGHSAVGRSSEDYKVGDLGRAKGHLYHSYSATPWIGQIAWGDHDMFHSSDRFAGRMMAVSKAMSGAPVYLSDAPSEFVPERIAPLTFLDGRLPRPLAPAGPVNEDVFHSGGEQRLYRVVAPLPNRSAAIAVYNLAGGVNGDDEELTTAITPEHYAQASGMIQPYPGDWPVPKEGILVYDWYDRRAARLDDSYSVSIRGFGDRLLELSPIVEEWSVVGRTDKYLSAAAVEVVSVDAAKLVVRLPEAGPFSIWSGSGQPKAPGVRFTDAGNGLYRAEIPVAAGQRTFVISR